MYSKISVMEISKMIVSINNKGKRIIMEKDNKGLSYGDLLDKLMSYNPNCGYDDEHSLRKALQAKKISDDLVNSLYDILEIKEMDLSEAMAVYRYNKNYPLKKGRPSNENLEERRKHYDEVHLEHNPEQGIYDMNRMIVESIKTEEIYQIGEDIFDGYLEYGYELEKRDMLKKMLVIFSCFPKEVKDFIQCFEFNKEEKSELDNLDVQIRRRQKSQ